MPAELGAVLGQVPALREDVFLSFLPLSHMLERTIGYYLPMAAGARYEVRLSRDALIARPVNDAAHAAVGDWGER